MTEELIGKSLNRYQITALLGKGGIGAVYRATDSVLQRDVAIKVMNPELAERSNFRDRFLNEARLAARLDHPSIVQVYDFGQGDELLYIVMEFIPGENLRKMLRDLRAQDKWVILTEAVQIVQQVAEALGYAHEQGVLHRDIKPDNLMLKPEPTERLPYRVVITDLGLAQIKGERQTFDDAGSIGTPAYMSPEQILGKETDVRSDVYSLGILLYELAVGRVPFPAKNLEDARRYHVHEPVPEPRSFRPELPVPLEKIILKSLQKDPASRYQDAAEMALALENVLPAVAEVSFTPSEMTDTISLVTQYDLTRADRPEIAPDPGTIPMGRQDYVEVLLPDKTVRNVAIGPAGLAIGRDPDNDLVIDSPKVSRQHARIQYENQKYWISDLNSRNGTFLSNKRLITGEPEIWTPDKPVRIGDVFLRLKHGTAYPSDLGETQVDGSPSAVIPAPFSTPVGPARVAIFMETLQLSVAPGSTAVAGFTILNRSLAPEHYKVSLLGLPPRWIPQQPPVIQLPPGGQRSMSIGIRPPESVDTRPGRYPLTIQVTNLDDPEQVAQVDFILTVGAYSRFSAEMNPKRLASDETTVISVHNLGNTRDTFRIVPTDQYGEFVFDPPDARLTLSENEAAAAEFRASMRRRRLFGSRKIQPFSAEITSSSGRRETLKGEILSSGVFPPVFLPLLLVACLCLSAMAAYGLFNPLENVDQARETASALTQAAALTEGALANANVETQTAATSTAVWLTLDSDADMLLNRDELERGTNPNVADTDGDTIPDGFEVHNMCTDPLKADTDDDGITDNIDPDPCNQFTPTPSPTMTSTNTPQPSVTVTVAPSATQQPSATATQQPSPTATTQPAATATPLGNSWIVIFSSARDGNLELYVMFPDGSRQTRITNSSSSETDPAISPDGTRLLFTTDRDGNQQIYVTNLDGTGQTRLSNNNFDDFRPSWSPDGSSIVFVSTRDGNQEIYAMNADGSNQRRLTDNSVSDDNPAWSPDGSRIIYDRSNAGGTSRTIQSINTNGSNRVELTGGDNMDLEPAWSPNGSQIAFVSNRDGDYDLYLMNADGSNQRRLTDLNTTVSTPAFSKDGNWIIFKAIDNGTGEILQINLQSLEIRNLTNNSVDDERPTW